MNGDGYRVTEVEDDGDSWRISYGGVGGGVGGSYGMLLSKRYGVRPKVGDTITVHTAQGSLVRGVELNGEVVYLKSDAQLEADRRRYNERRRREADETFEREKERMDREFDRLPGVFKRRIRWFREHNERFRQDYESYEMSACRDAVKIAEWALAPTGAGKPVRSETPEQRVRRFATASIADQRRWIPDLAYSDHSGNSFAFACRLAQHFVGPNPDLVYHEHGAMVPLVGCEAYGCAHPRF